MNEPIILTHGIKFMPHHFWSDGKLFQLSHCPNKRTLPQKFLSEVSQGNNRSCKGFQIYGKFKSKTSLMKRLYPLTKIIIETENECPF